METKVKKVTCYETSDGSVFHDLEKASEHQDIVDFTNWYEDNKLFGDRDGSRVEAGDLISWLIKHKDKVLSIIKK